MSGATSMETESTTSSSSAVVVPSFDVESYIQRYAVGSETRLQRLLFLGIHHVDKDARRHCLELSIQQMKEVGNVVRYRELFDVTTGEEMTGMIGTAGGEAGSESAPPPRVVMEDDTSPNAAQVPPSRGSSSRNSGGSKSKALDLRQVKVSDYGLSYDASFVAATEHQSTILKGTLDGRLATAQARMMKEAIRTAYWNLVEYHSSRGELRDGLRKAMRVREFCTTNRQIAQVCLLVMELGIQTGSYKHVRSFVEKAEHTTVLLQTDASFASKVKVASALAFLAEGAYEEAAREILQVSSELQYNTVVSAEDVAIYGCLLSLATLDRQELNSNVLENASFKSRLELTPPLRDAVRHFVRADYGACLSLLKPELASLRMDLYISAHVDPLMELIRHRCMVQYLEPYSSCRLDQLAASLDEPNVQAVQDAVATLILEGKVGNRKLNSLTQTVHVEDFHPTLERRLRRRTRNRIHKLGYEFTKEVESMLLRMSCIEQNMVVEKPGRSGSRRSLLGRGSSMEYVRSASTEGSARFSYAPEDVGGDAGHPMVDDDEEEMMDHPRMMAEDDVGL